jgi:hypothetical protein
VTPATDLAKVVGNDRRLAVFVSSPTTFLVGPQSVRVLLILLVVQPGEPRREPLDRRLKLGMEINKGSQLIGEPGERDLILASARLELLDAAIREVHGSLI